MEVIVSAIVVFIAAGCFLAIVAKDLREDDRLFLLRDASWLTSSKSLGNSARK